MKTLLGSGGGGGGGVRLLEGGCLKEGGVHKFFLILGGAFIGGRRLKEEGRLLDNLP